MEADFVTGIEICRNTVRYVLGPRFSFSEIAWRTLELIGHTNVAWRDATNRFRAVLRRVLQRHAHALVFRTECPVALLYGNDHDARVRRGHTLLAIDIVTNCAHELLNACCFSRCTFVNAGPDNSLGTLVPSGQSFSRIMSTICPATTIHVVW
jgi:hypothetical protein